MEHLLKPIGSSAAATLDALSQDLGDAERRVIDLGNGHAPLHVERHLRLGDALRVAHYFEGGSRREGRRLTPAPEMVFVRGSAGWSVGSLRDPFVERSVISASGDAILVDNDARKELVDFANGWRGNVQARLVAAARRAA